MFPQFSLLFEIKFILLLQAVPSSTAATSPNTLSSENHWRSSPTILGTCIYITHSSPWRHSKSCHSCITCHDLQISHHNSDIFHQNVCLGWEGDGGTGRESNFPNTYSKYILIFISIYFAHMLRKWLKLKEIVLHYEHRWGLHSRPAVCVTSVHCL